VAGPGDAFTFVLKRFETNLDDAFKATLTRAAVEAGKDWRTESYVAPKLEALSLVSA